MRENAPKGIGPYVREYDSRNTEKTPSWMLQLQEASIANFKAKGFPVGSSRNEEWKYTNLTKLAELETVATQATPGYVDSMSELDLSNSYASEQQIPSILFLNGTYQPNLSNRSSQNQGIRIQTFHELYESGETSTLEEHFGQYVKDSSNEFVSLNTALADNGVLIEIDSSTSDSTPIHIANFYTDTDSSFTTSPRILIVAPKGGSAIILETHEGTGENQYFVNSVTEIYVGQNSDIQHYLIQTQNSSAFHISNTGVHLAADSKFLSVNVDLGGSLIRHNLDVLTAEPGSSCILNGLYIVDGDRHCDNQVIIDHAAPHTTSRELYKGVLDDESRSVFHGSVIVREGAVKVNADQADKNLLLSDKAEADTKPAFWVYCDDVICRHGAACGQIDPAAMFYLQSRGIEAAEARQILTKAFLAEITESVTSPTVKSHVETLVSDRLSSLKSNA